MRVDVKKFLFYGLAEDKEAFFVEAQKAGIIHFIAQPEKPALELPPEIQHLTGAIKVLRGLEPVPQEEPADADIGHGMALRILKLQEKIIQLEQALRINRLEMARVEPFGDFSVEELQKFERIAQRKVQFFFAKQGFAEENELPDGLIFIKSDHSLDYFMAINKTPVQYAGMTEMAIQQPYGVLKQDRQKLETDRHDTEQELKKYAKYKDYLHKTLIQAFNHYHLQDAQVSAGEQFDGGIFVIEGWVPVNKAHTLERFVKKLNVHAEEVAVETDERIPTYLENQGFNRLGEDLVHIYDTPSPTDKDPSFWVMLWFAFFFSMIIGDAGYGLVFLGTALYVRYKTPKLTDLGTRVWKIAVILACGCILWGILTTSFFGISVPIDSPIRKVSLMNWLVEKKAAYHFERKDAVYQDWVKRFPQLENMQNPQQILLTASKENAKGAVVNEMYNDFSDAILMELALLVGTIHVIVSLLRYADRNWAAIGWVIFIIGAYLYLPTYLKATSLINIIFNVPTQTTGINGLYMMYVGLPLAFILSLIKNKLFALLEVMTLIQIFADILSYLRLYALALAGAMVTATLNEFAGASNIIVATLLLIFGHVVNMALGIMGGVIHGLRLNFLEWYHYSFEGGGKRFTPLSLQKFE